MKNRSNAITIFAHFPRVFMSSITRWQTRPSHTRTCVCSSSIFICIFLAPDSPLNRPTPSISTINIISQQLQSSLNRGARNERMHDTSISNSLLVILPSLFAHPCPLFPLSVHRRLLFRWSRIFAKRPLNSPRDAVSPRVFVAQSYVSIRTYKWRECRVKYAHFKKAVRIHQKTKEGVLLMDYGFVYDLEIR